MLIIVPSSELGGAEINLIRILSGLDYNLFYPLVLLPKKGPLCDRLNQLKIRTFISSWPHHFSHHSKLEWFVLKTRLTQFLKNKPIHLIFNNSLFSLELAHNLEKVLNCPLITYWHDNHCPEKVIPFLKAHPTMPIICVSKATEQTLKKKTSFPLKTIVIYNGIPSQPKLHLSKENARQILGLSPNLFYIGFTGRLVPQKGLDILIKAISQLSNKINLVFAGKWDNNAYKNHINQLIKQSNVQNRTHYLGFLDNTDLFYAAIDILGMPSKNESFGLSALEAMSFKTPVLCHAVGGLREQIIDHINGIWVKNNDINDWIDKINLLFQNQLLYNKLSTQAQKKSLEFDLETCVKQINALIKKTASQ